MDTDQLFLRLQEETQNGTLRLFCRTLDVIDQDFLALISRCLLNDTYGIFETLLKEKAHYVYNSKPLVNCVKSRAIKLALVSGRSEWVKSLCELSGHLSNKAVLAIWEIRNFEALQICFARNSSSRMVLRSYTFQTLLELSLRDECPKECLHHFNELLFKDRPREILQILPNKSVDFEYGFQLRSELSSWGLWCLTHDYMYAAVYILLLVQDFFEAFESVIQMCLDNKSDRKKLTYVTTLCLLAVLRTRREDQAEVVTALAELYANNELLDTLAHLMEHELETAEWQVMAGHLIGWCDGRGLKRFKVLLLIRAEYWVKAERVVFSNGDTELVDYAMTSIPYVTLRSLWCGPHQQFVVRLFQLSSQKAVILGHVLLRAALSNDLGRIHSSLSAFSQSDATELFGDLDLEFLWPLLAGREAGDEDSGQRGQCDSKDRDMAIRLIRSGLLQQFRSWLVDSQLPECGCEGGQECQCKGILFYLYAYPVSRNIGMQTLILRSGFLPYTVLFQLRGSVAAQRQAGRSSYAETLEQFVYEPYSLQTLCVGVISLRVGCRSGRSERIQQLKIPALLRKSVAFKHAGFKLSTEEGGKQEEDGE